MLQVGYRLSPLASCTVAWQRRDEATEVELARRKEQLEHEAETLRARLLNLDLKASCRRDRAAAAGDTAAQGCSKGPDGTWVHTVVGVQQASSLANLVSAHFHCHAPTCLSMSIARSTASSLARIGESAGPKSLYFSHSG